MDKIQVVLFIMSSGTIVACKLVMAKTIAANAVWIGRQVEPNGIPKKVHNSLKFKMKR